MTTDGPSSDLTAPNGLVDVVLPESPSTGYRWTMVSQDDRAQVVDDRFDDQPTGGPPAGAGGLRTFSVRLTGTVALEFVLQRPWDTEPLERRTITVTSTD
ncbi:MAG: Chagasin family peptidase inhibitor [Nocardioidaceae bacterium]|nr:Chagasin family peptidase inhibitor [Nocardioidaceae bacterium]